MSIIIKNPEQIEGIRKSCQLAKSCLDYIEPFVVPGVTTEQLDLELDAFIRKHDAIPACLNYKEFPKSTCISVNEVVCHGIPDGKTLQDGDILNIDVTTILNGYYGDTCRMFSCGNISSEAKKLIDVTKRALEVGIAQVYPTNKIGRIGAEILRYTTRMGFTVVENYCGHGVGLEFHEEPQVPNSCSEFYGPVMKPGMIFTVEPMINQGKDEVILDSDGWTVRTIDGKLSAQFEHTVLVTETGVEILTI